MRGEISKKKKIKKLNPVLPLSLRIKDGVRFFPKKESENPCLENHKLSINWDVLQFNKSNLRRPTDGTNSC